MDITIYFKTGKHLIFKDISNLNVFANTLTFNVNWNTNTLKGTKSFTFKEYVGYGIYNEKK